MSSVITTPEFSIKRLRWLLFPVALMPLDRPPATFHKDQMLPLGVHAKRAEYCRLRVAIGRKVLSEAQSGGVSAFGQNRT